MIQFVLKAGILRDWSDSVTGVSMSNDFYQLFEKSHRGSVELIKSRLQVYLPFITPLKKLYDNPRALDLGCGRGEWLSLLQENGFRADGVDLNEQMVLTCQQQGLRGIQCDALSYMKCLSNDSLCVISAIHFAEHVSFDELKQIVQEAYRILKPGGLLILETPNIENLLVGTSKFHLDPTHKCALPAELLSFLAEYVQFYRVKSLFLQEPTSVKSAKEMTLLDVFEGVSPDCGIVAQKNIDAMSSMLFDLPFDREYGTRLIPLITQYDKQRQIEKEELYKSIATSEDRLMKSIATLEDRLMKYIAMKDRLMVHKIIMSIYHGRVARRFKAYLNAIMLKGARQIGKHPRLKIYISCKMRKYPWFRKKAHQLKARLSLVAHENRLACDLISKNTKILSPCAYRIYVRLAKMVEEKECNNAYSA
jgi:SAM-dependent methyltransferase